jgi:hypothetical protein
MFGLWPGTGGMAGSLATCCWPGLEAEAELSRAGALQHAESGDPHAGHACRGWAAYRSSRLWQQPSSCTKRKSLLALRLQELYHASWKMGPSSGLQRCTSTTHCCPVPTVGLRWPIVRCAYTYWFVVSALSPAFLCHV